MFLSRAKTHASLISRVWLALRVLPYVLSGASSCCHGLCCPVCMLSWVMLPCVCCPVCVLSWVMLPVCIAVCVALCVCCHGLCCPCVLLCVCVTPVCCSVCNALSMLHCVLTSARPVVKLRFVCCYL